MLLKQYQDIQLKSHQFFFSLFQNGVINEMKILDWFSGQDRTVSG